MKRFIPFLLVLVFALPVSADGQEKNAAAVLEEFYPEGTILFYAVNSVPDLLTEGKKLPSVSFALKIMDSLERQFRLKEQAERALSDIGLSVDKIPVHFPGELALGVYPRDNVEEGENDLELCIIARLGRESEERAFVVESIFRKIRNQISINNVQTNEYPGYVITSFTKSKKEVLSYAVYKSFLIITTTKNELVKTVYRMKERRDGVLSDNMQYKITADENKGKHHVRFYMNAEEVGARIRKIIPPAVLPYFKFLEPTGLPELQGVYGTALLTEKGVSENFNLYFEEIKGAVSLFTGIGNLAFDYTKVPASAFSVNATAVDLVLLWDFVLDTMKKYSSLLPSGFQWAEELQVHLTEAEAASAVNVKDDILRNMDNSICLFSFAGQKNPGSPKTIVQVAAVKLFNKAKTFQNIIYFFNNGLKLQLTEMKVGEDVVYYRQFTDTYIAFVLIKDTLYIGTHYRDIEKLVTVLKNKGSILDNAKFAEYIKDQEMKSVSFFDYEKQFSEMDTEENTDRELKKFLPKNVKLPDFTKFGKLLNMFGMKVRFRGNRVMYDSISPVPLQIIIPAVSGYFVLVEIPKYPERREARRKEETVKKLLDIQTQLELYALENGGRYPSSLADLYPRYIEKLETFDEPSEETKIRFKDEINDKAMFVLRKFSLTEKINPNGVRIYQKKGMHPDGYYVLLNNGSVEFRPTETYDAMVEKFKGSSVEIIE